MELDGVLSDEDSSTLEIVDLDKCEDADDAKHFDRLEEPPAQDPFQPFEGEFEEDLDRMRSMGLPVAFGSAQVIFHAGCTMDIPAYRCHSFLDCFHLKFTLN